LSGEIVTALDTVIRSALQVAATPPQSRQQPPLPRLPRLPRWTLKRLVAWVKAQFATDCCRDTLRKILKKLGFSWKKARKLLNKASPSKRAAFLQTLQGLFAAALQQRELLVYIDEAHIHLDTDEGYGWSIRGDRFWVSSSSPGLEKVSFYGVYLYNRGEVRIFAYDKAEQFNTVAVLKQLRMEFPDIPINLVWDGAPYHRAHSVREAAESLGIRLAPLPGYSPDLMPVEHLWQWLREEVTYHTCYETKADLMEQVKRFEQQINADPIGLADRLWVKNHLDHKEEKLRVSS
jgi:transposase